jgi:P-type Cu+ transporter
MQDIQNINKKIKTICYHCGDDCRDESISIDDKFFCCFGCKTVFEILDKKKMHQYYELYEYPGISQKTKKHRSNKYEYLDNPEIQNKLIEFSNEQISSVTFRVPSVHCSSCIWLLENLYQINKSILRSEVDFTRKKVNIKYKKNEITLRKVVESMVLLGYEPDLTLNDSEEKTIPQFSNRKLFYRIGIAGFCFGNIMLLSFPEYLGLDTIIDSIPKSFFGYLIILLGLPVFFYCSSDYFKSAYSGLKEKFINIDFPISLGLFVLFTRSLYEIISQTGPGFIDSMAGLVFLLLLGKLFQSKTYDLLNFERKYTSYFPVSVTVINKGAENSIPVSRLKEGDRILVRNNELVPADALLFRGEANIDYSFVTGESASEKKVLGEVVYAGGKQAGGAIELEVIRTVSHSYFTQLWNSDAFIKKDDHDFSSMINSAAKYFTIAILLVASGAAFYWFPVSVAKAVNAFTAVLIIACPCGLALTSPFALGNALRILGKNKFYLKNTAAVEKMSKIDTIIFDKTGTITNSGAGELIFIGNELIDYEKSLVKSLVRNSSHPLSSIIYSNLSSYNTFEVENFREEIGEGLSGEIDGHKVKLGSSAYISKNIIKNKEDDKSTNVFIEIDGKYKGYFTLKNKYRDGFPNIIESLKKNYNFVLLSGDNDAERLFLSGYFDVLHFNQSPLDKLNFVKDLQLKKRNVMMIGDGLNDAGALKQSNVGVVISDDVAGFSPASDAILDSSVLSLFTKYLQFIISAKKIIIISFIISALYNIIGVFLAFQGNVSPLLAAILMPVSSVSVIIFTVLSTNFAAMRKGLL